MTRRGVTEGAEVEGVLEVDGHPPARRVQLNNTNNGFWELSDLVKDINLQDDNREEDDIAEEEKLSNNQDDGNK